MLDLNVTIKGNKLIIAGLAGLAEQMPKAVQRGLSRVAKGVDRLAYEYLSGAGSKKMFKGQLTLAGGYPVPVRTGHLRRMLDWLDPGETKTVGAFSDIRTHKQVTKGGTFTAGPMEAIVYNAAIYAKVIEEGTKSSKKYGARPYMRDALHAFNEGGRTVRTIESEIRKEVRKHGLS